MEVTFLGTGTSGGVPLIGCQCRVCKSTDPRDKRLRTSILIRTDILTLTIDCGPDFRQQMLREDVRHLDAVLMTHQHKDHTGGIDDIRSFNFINQKPIDFYCDKATERGIKDQYSYAFADSDYAYKAQIKFKHISDQPFEIPGLPVPVIPIEVLHDKMPVMGYRFSDFTYITDAKTISPEERMKIRGTKVLVINALKKEPHFSHFSINEALEVVDDLKPELTYFIHMSHQFGLHAEMEKLMPPHVRIAYDGLKIQV